jgi:hypothetical protein
MSTQREAVPLQRVNPGAQEKQSPALQILLAQLTLQALQ